MFWESEVQLLPEAPCTSAAEGRVSVRCTRVQPSSPPVAFPPFVLISLICPWNSFLLRSLSFSPSFLFIFLYLIPGEHSPTELWRVRCVKCEWPGQPRRSFVRTSFSLV